MTCAIEQELPEELLDHIVSLTPRESLRNLCLTSKTFNRLATPYLYSNVYLRETDHLPALTYLVNTSPTHAALVKSFVVSSTWAETEEKFTAWSWPRSEDPNLKKVLRSRCAQYTSSKEEAGEMYNKFESGANEDAILALLLANLPKLQRLNINFGICQAHTDFVAIWPTIVQAARSSSESPLGTSTNPVANVPRSAGSSAFSVPVDILVSGASERDPNHTKHLAIFFHLPNLRSIYGYRHGDHEGDLDSEHPFTKLKLHSCPVEYIELRCAKLHSDNLHSLLGATIPGKLKTFSYEVGCSWAWCKVEHPRIMVSLQPHHDTLETLGLSHEEYYPYEASDGSDGKPYPCSFTPFTVLKHLKVAPVYVWGHRGFTQKVDLDNPETKQMLWKSLPECLEELWITRAHHQKLSGNNATIRFVPDCLLPALNLVVQHKSEAFRNLKQLQIELPLLEWKDGWLDILASFCKTAASNQIRCTVILFDMFDKFGRLTVERPWGWNEEVEWEPTRYSQNRECAKIWIDAAEHQDLAETLKDLKTRFEEENEKLKKATAEINQLGMLCTDCQLGTEYRADLRIDVVQLARYIDERLHTKTGWKGRSGPYPVVT